MPLFVEITYDSAAGLRADWEAQLKGGKLSVAGAFGEEPPLFSDVILVLMVAGSEAARVPAVVISASERETHVEVVPESRAFLSTMLQPLIESGALGGPTDGKRVRLFDDTRESAPSGSDESSDEAPTGKHRPDARKQDATDTKPIAKPEPLSLEKKIAALSVGEKVRLAMHGTRDERVWLARERAGVVQSSLVRNPRVTIDEVLALARAPHLSPDAAEAMLTHPTYGASAQVAVALVRNPRTPIPLAVDLVNKLQPHDLRVIAKGLNVRTPIAQAARKRLHNTG